MTTIYSNREIVYVFWWGFQEQRVNGKPAPVYSWKKKKMIRTRLSYYFDIQFENLNLNLNQKQKNLPRQKITGFIREFWSNIQRKKTPYILFCNTVWKTWTWTKQFLFYNLFFKRATMFKFLSSACSVYKTSLILAVPSTALYCTFTDAFAAPIPDLNKQPYNKQYNTGYTCAERVMLSFCKFGINAGLGFAAGFVYPVTWSLYAWHHLEKQNPEKYGICNKYYFVNQTVRNGICNKVEN